MIGQTIAHYRITAKLGEGGMGAVYRATDNKLNREVALKVLPPALANDADYLARFQREAQVLASLNHPNIAQIYGVEQDAIVMELVEGRNLEGPIPLEEAISIAKQIAEALEAAHEKGVIHRDLKPANVKITPEGVVKVLDFGLAKAAAQSATGDSANSPTLTIRSTQAGMILGTAAYMAPEQARGQAVDRRADIWSFGAVLFEMLTGKMAFPGDNITDILASVVKLEPEWNALPSSTPKHVRTLLRRCLTKDRRLRLQAIGEARIALEHPESAGIEPQAGRPPGARVYRVVAGIALLAALAAGAIAWRMTRPMQRPLVRLTVEPGAGFVPMGIGANVILSPDGTRLVYTGRGPDGKVRLYTRPLDQESATPLEGTDGAGMPFFSPDGESVGFFAGGKLRKVFVRGGGAVVLCDAPLPQGGAWGEDGNIIAALASSGGLSRISQNGGAPQPVSQLQKELSHRWPQVLPGAEAVLFSAYTAGIAFDDARIEVQSLRTGRRKTLVRGGTYGRYARSGHLLYVWQGLLFAAPMDLGKLELTGPAASVVDGVTANAYGGAPFDISSSGTLVYAKNKAERQNLFWLDSTGRMVPLRAGAAEYAYNLQFSPDGKRLAVVLIEGGNPDIWVYEWERDTMTRLTFTPGFDSFPLWSPDGKHIVFTSARHGGPQNLYWMRADGAGEAVRLTESETAQFPASLSPDGRRVRFTEVNPRTGYDLWTVALEDVESDRPKAGKPEPFLQNAVQRSGSRDLTRRAVGGLQLERVGGK
jgi:predicted Ser/Thr protein kinase